MSSAAYVGAMGSMTMVQIEDHKPHHEGGSQVSGPVGTGDPAYYGPEAVAARMARPEGVSQVSKRFGKPIPASLRDLYLEAESRTDFRAYLRDTGALDIPEHHWVVRSRLEEVA